MYNTLYSRGRLCDELADFMEEEERNSYTLQLEDTENWLYEEGEDADRPAYQLRLSDLKASLPNPIRNFFKDPYPNPHGTGEGFFGFGSSAFSMTFEFWPTIKKMFMRFPDEKLFFTDLDPV